MGRARVTVRRCPVRLFGRARKLGRIGRAFVDRRDSRQASMVMRNASATMKPVSSKLCNWVGATPIAATRHSAKAATLLAHGVKHVVTTAEGDVMRITGGKGGDDRREARAVDHRQRWRTEASIARVSRLLRHPNGRARRDRTTAYLRDRLHADSRSLHERGGSASAGGDRVCEAGVRRLEAEVFADPATVEERVGSAPGLGVRAVRRRPAHRR
jgi:hypothetical protein